MSLTELQAYTLIYDKWRNEWPSLYNPTIVFKLENEQFKEPSDPTASWVEVQVRPLNSMQETIGPPGQREYLRFCNVWVRLHVPKNSGTAHLRDMVDKVRGIYEGTSFGGISPGISSSARTFTIENDGRWYEIDVSIPLQYQERR